MAAALRLRVFLINRYIVMNFVSTPITKKKKKERKKMRGNPQPNGNK